MKKLLFFAICLLVAGAVNAQGYYYGPGYNGPPRRIVRRPPPRRQSDNFYTVRVGITGGLNVSNTISNYSGSSTGTIAAFNAGLTLDIPLVYPVSFEPEVLISQKGYTGTDYAADGSSVGNFTQRANFIDVPLLLKFHLGPIVNFVLGPQISFPISTTYTFDNGIGATDQQKYNNTADRTLVGGVAGIGFDLSRNVELRARYTYDFNGSDENAANGNAEFRYQVFQVGLGFKF